MTTLAHTLFALLAVVALGFTSVASAADRPTLRGTGEVRLAPAVGVTVLGGPVFVYGQVHKPVVFYVIGRAAAAPHGLIGEYAMPTPGVRRTAMPGF